jgi:FkbH-like protein
LSFWNDELGLGMPVRFAAFNQVFQALLDPTSVLNTNAGGVNVVLARLEDWAAAGDDAPGQFAEALRKAPVAAEWIVILCPGLGKHAEAASMLRASLAGLGSVQFAEADEVLALYPVSEVADAAAEALGRVPYTEEFFAALGTWIARRVNALRMPPYKVLALDCDNTLWEGICGEDGPAGVKIGPGNVALQRIALEQREAGMLLALCSKNNEADVFETMAAHPEMPLKPEHLTAWRINWEPKSAGLDALASELDLALDSFVFADDDRRECAEVQASCPGVLTLPLPEDAGEMQDFLRHVWAFDRVRVTEADRKRAEQYAQRAERQNAARMAGSLAEFLAGIQLQVRIAAPAAGELARVAQVTQRTNQMNTSGARFTEAELRARLDAGTLECLAVHVADRFGDYGLVGVMLYRAEETALRVEAMLLSCRALGRGVEHRMLAHVGRLAVERGLETIEIAFTPMARNAPARAFLESFGVGCEKGLYSIPASEAAAHVWTPPETPAVLPSSNEGGPRAAARRMGDYARIANSLRTAGQVVAAVKARRGAARLRHVAAEGLPQGETEERLAALWTELLGASPIGRDESFFDLGGHSLLAVQLLSRITREFGVELTLDVVYGGPLTIAELARAIELGGLEMASPEEYEALLREIEAMPDEEVRAQLEAAQGERTES